MAKSGDKRGRRMEATAPPMTDSDRELIRHGKNPKSRRSNPVTLSEEEAVRRLAFIQCTRAEMAAILDMSEDTLNYKYGKLIEKYNNMGRRSLRRKQYQVALRGNPTMLIWMGKNTLDQSDAIRHTGPKGGPIDLNVLSDAELVQQARAAMTGIATTPTTPSDSGTKAE
jgi:DNA-binding CsgD family transcriptional regulator